MAEVAPRTPQDPSIPPENPPHFGLKEQLIFTVETTALFLAMGLYSFSDEIRARVIREQHGRCADCGVEPAKLYLHHRVPISRGGSDERQNAVGLCNGSDNHCHDKWDALALEGDTIYPGLHISEIPRRQFADRYAFQKSRKIPKPEKTTTDTQAASLKG